MRIDTLEWDWAVRLGYGAVGPADRSSKLSLLVARSGGGRALAEHGWTFGCARVIQATWRVDIWMRSADYSNPACLRFLVRMATLISCLV